ncbi:hypothetical protein GBF38_021186 [Nibea albiflora]|uniref:Uncharacterized protein n=1 Tax=Nibea albiflora TaxID=240163 RepID=A0ACB7EX42_NIBAL|nr:hypothetical protein GBF38_021186 [Nibea albiflora]
MIRPDYLVVFLILSINCAGVNSINLVQPESMVVQPGQSVTITCQVSGYSLTDNSYATGVNSINLVQPESMVVQPGQSVTITCQVSGYSMTDDSYATDKVVKPVVSVYPAASRAHPDEKSFLVCVASAMFPPRVKFSWKRQKEDGSPKEVPRDVGEQLELRESGRAASILLIHRHESSAYKYRCSVQHMGSTVEAQIKQGVNSINLVQPESMVVQPGQSVTITCQVSGYSMTNNNYATGWIRQCEGKPMDWISHQWGGGGLTQNNALKNKFGYSRDTSARTVTLKGQSMQPEDTAVYYCARLTTVIQSTNRPAQIPEAM